MNRAIIHLLKASKKKNQIINSIVFDFLNSRDKWLACMCSRIHSVAARFIRSANNKENGKSMMAISTRLCWLIYAEKVLRIITHSHQYFILKRVFDGWQITCVHRLYTLIFFSAAKSLSDSVRPAFSSRWFIDIRQQQYFYCSRMRNVTRFLLVQRETFSGAKRGTFSAGWQEDNKLHEKSILIWLWWNRIGNMWKYIVVFL